jgi:23S rRNA-/tRNA-specific pseudouridylate synthase
MAKPAETDYEVLARAEAPEDESISTSLFKIMPRTGRTHQIRVHLASIGHPVVGDPLYGPHKPRLEAPRLMLHALSIEFERRPGERLNLEAGPGEIFLDFIVRCGYPQGILTRHV